MVSRDVSGLSAVELGTVYMSDREHIKALESVVSEILSLEQEKDE